MTQGYHSALAAIIAQKKSIDGLTLLMVEQGQTAQKSEKTEAPEPEKPTATDDAAADEAKTTSKRRK